MSVVVAVLLFVAALAVTLAAAATFARRLDRLGAKYGLPEVWIGLLTAFAADGPEVSSALVALIKGAHDASVGVIVGSNTFNLAAMIGASALIAGCVQVARNTLVLEGTVARRHGDRDRASGRLDSTSRSSPRDRLLRRPLPTPRARR